MGYCWRGFAKEIDNIELESHFSVDFRNVVRETVRAAYKLTFLISDINKLGSNMFWLFLPVIWPLCLSQYASYQTALIPYGTTDLSFVFNYPLNLYSIPGGDKWCPLTWGSPFCKPAIQCSVWFLDLLYNPWWCWAWDGSFGTCCPDVYVTASSVARFPEISKLVAVPYDLKPSEIDAVLKNKALLADISDYEWKTWDKMTYPWRNSAGFSYSATTYATGLAQQEGWKGLQVVEATRKIATILKLKPKEAGFATQFFKLKDTALAFACRQSPVCYNTFYRTYDGSCNNLKYPNWGRSNMPLERILPPQYADGIWAPRDWPGLPPVATVSGLLEDINYPDQQLTITVMHWGQLTAHDITHVPTYRTLNNSAIQCCTLDGKYLPHDQTHPLCFPIDVPSDHIFYNNYGVSCLEFVRSVIAPREDCSFGYANQLNQNTAYLDGSTIYGSTEEVARSLREYKGGRMRVSVTANGIVLLPTDPSRTDCITDDYQDPCFVAGDVRVNQYTSLTALHILLIRQHNLLAMRLATINPHWDDERLYQETKKIMVAIIQHITFNEYLPSVLGRKVMEEYGLVPLTSGYTYTYDPQVNPAITNEFATAAFRYGHSLIQNWNELWLDDTYSNYGGRIYLKDWYNRPQILSDPVLLNALIRNFITQPAQNFDENIADAVHHYLFKAPNQNWGLDLISSNIWRGRDHGIAGYNFYLEACGSPRAQDFNDLLTILRPDVVQAFQLIYGSVDDIDLFAGILGEFSVKGGLVGPVTACIIADQFSRLKDGDRFFYELGGQPHSFTLGQLNEIRKTSLARIFCDTADTVSWITHNVFWTPSPMNPWLPCYGKDIPQMDLLQWKEY